MTGVRQALRAWAEQQINLHGPMVVVDRIVAKRKAPASSRGESIGAGSEQVTYMLAEITEPWVAATSLDALDHVICSCQKCALGSTRTKFVFGVGNPNADIVIVGEAPGAEEDRQGEPFVGAAGQLLNKILAAVSLGREEVYIANILKCRPPGNRTPERGEVEECEPYLIKQLQLIKPRFILALGLTAANTLLKKKERMSDLRGSIHDYHGIAMIVTYHPAALLRNPQWKRSTWEDVQMLRRLYDESQSMNRVGASS